MRCLVDDIKKFWQYFLLQDEECVEGYSKEELTGKTLFETIVQDIEASRNGVQDMVENIVAGCISMDSIRIVVSADPVIPVIQANNYQEGDCQGDHLITLQVDTVELNTLYQWKRNG